MIAHLVLIGAVAILPPPGTIFAPNDPRYCGEPARYENGRIKRSQLELTRFARIFPCPSTLKPISSCPGWQIDHIIPLASGGCDKTINMQWLPIGIKTCDQAECKDRWERQYHSLPRKQVEF